MPVACWKYSNKTHFAHSLFFFLSVAVCLSITVMVHYLTIFELLKLIFRWPFKLRR